MKKKIFFAFLTTFVILGLMAACSWRGNGEEDVVADAPAAPSEVEVTREVTRIVTEAPPEDDPCPPGWPTDVEGMDVETCPAEWGVLYLKAEQDLFVYALVGVNGNGFPILSKTATPYTAGEIIVAYNSWNGVSYDYEFNDLANAQGSMQVGENEWAKEFPGLWRGDGMTMAYELAGQYGAGLFVRADDVSVPDCEDLFLEYPLSCTQ